MMEYIKPFIDYLTSSLKGIPIDLDQLRIYLLAFIAGVGIAIPVILLLRKAIDWLEIRLLRSNLLSAGKTLIKLKNKEDDGIPEAVKRALKLQDESEQLPEWMEGWVKQVEGRISSSGRSIPVGRYVTGVILGCAVGFIIGIAILNNLSVAIIFGISAFLVPDVFLVGYAQTRQAKMIDQLSSAVRIFSAEFASTPQVGSALRNTARRVPAPLGDVLNHACRQLSAGRSKEQVLQELVQELDFDYGRMFVQLLRMAWEDSAVQPLFARLATRVSSLQALMKKNQSNLAQGRMMAMGVNALILPMFFGVQWLVPGAHEFLTTHVIGRGIVSFAFSSILVWLVLDRVLNGVKI